jgi:ABC-type antimicrobial peptide transport system permease subunit
VVFVVRHAPALAGLEPALRRAARTDDPALADAGVHTPAAIYGEALAAQRSTGVLAVVFGGLALLVAVVGVYAVMTAWIAQRRREAAIRMAVGASPARALRDLAAPGVRLVAVGLALGSAALAGLGDLLAASIEGLDPSLSLPLAVAAGLLGLCAVAACLAPARRMTRRDPVGALREP